MTFGDKSQGQIYRQKSVCIYYSSNYFAFFDIDYIHIEHNICSRCVDEKNYSGFHAWLLSQGSRSKYLKFVFYLVKLIYCKCFNVCESYILYIDCIMCVWILKIVLDF